MSMAQNLREKNRREQSRERIIVQTSIIGIIANVFLAGFKAVIGLMTHSIAIVMSGSPLFSTV